MHIPAANQLVSLPVNESISQSIGRSAGRWVSRSVRQLVSQSVCQSVSQSNSLKQARSKESTAFFSDTVSGPVHALPKMHICKQPNKGVCNLCD